MALTCPSSQTPQFLLAINASTFGQVPIFSFLRSRDSVFLVFEKGKCCLGYSNHCLENGSKGQRPLLFIAGDETEATFKVLLLCSSERWGRCHFHGGSPTSILRPGHSYFMLDLPGRVWLSSPYWVVPRAVLLGRAMRRVEREQSCRC